MPQDSAVRIGRDSFLRQFRWQDGDADIWRVFFEPDGLAAVVNGLAEPWRDCGITHVVGIESRGFLLGAAVAVNLGVGFQPVRKSGGLLPGPTSSVTTEPDYRSQRHDLRMQQAFTAGHVALLVDDWAERGSQARAVRELIAMSGAHFAGVSLVVDELTEEVRKTLNRVTSLVRADELGDPRPAVPVEDLDQDVRS